VRLLAAVGAAPALGEQGVQQNWKGMASYATVGLEFGLSVLVGLLGGRWLDGKLGTGSWLALIGFGFGVAAGGRAIYRAAQAANRDAERESNEERSRRQRYHDDDPRQ
jgi:F0F1-type ATP synthase assembly protein I